MKTVALLLPVLWLAFSPLAGAAESQAKKADDDKPIAEKAAELSAGKTNRVDKVLALHGFVRDSVSQIKTQWG